MSAPQQFATITAALKAFAAGRCKRWVSVDGHQIDLIQAQAEAGRVREEPGETEQAPTFAAGVVARNVLAELARAAHVLPELAAPEMPADASAYRCPWCSQPWDGAS